MRTIRPIALLSLLSICIVSSAQEPTLKSSPTLRPSIAPMTVEQQLAAVQDQVAKLQAQVATLQSALVISQGNVRLQGGSVIIASNSSLTLQATELTAVTQRDLKLKAGMTAALEATGPLTLKGSYIQQN